MRVVLVAVALISACALFGCRTHSTCTRTHSETRETVKERRIAETGTDVPTATPGAEEKTTTRTETKEQVLEKGPVVK